MKTVVFLGPSLPAREARNHLDAIYLPPAGQADLISAIFTHAPERMVLIDGVFGQSLSVWHKEILFALSQGIQVFGASSMGALRAIELGAFGMHGHGVVFDMYKSGEIEDDDEVALSHGNAYSGYAHFSVPMVTVRATLSAALSCGVISPEQRTVLTAIAKAQHFAQRTVLTILSAARAAHMPHDTLSSLTVYLDENGLSDVKREDAIGLLKHLAAAVDQESTPVAFDDFNHSLLFDVLYHRDRKVGAGESGVTLSAIPLHDALHNPQHHELNREAMYRGVILNYAKLRNVSVERNELDSKVTAFRQEHNLEDAAALQSWLARNDLLSEDFERLMREEVCIEKMQKWLTSMNFKMQNTKLYLDVLRLRGSYVERKQETLDRIAAAQAHGIEKALPRMEQTRLKALISSHILGKGWVPPTDWNAWLAQSSIYSWHEFEQALEMAELNLALSD